MPDLTNSGWKINCRAIISPNSGANIDANEPSARKKRAMHKRRCIRDFCIGNLPHYNRNASEEAMGVYLNPGNSGFARIIKSEYVDKTGLIGIINSTIGTVRNLTCISRPRRFGKSYAAQMLSAYYDKTCDSKELFQEYEIAANKLFAVHLNKYDVIYLDMTNLLGKVKPLELIDFISGKVTEELLESYPHLEIKSTFDETLIEAVKYTGNKFIMIIDEWDAPIRETPEIEKAYLRFLRMLFKSSSTTSRIFAAAYVTGILPIKKDGSQSAISDLRNLR